MQLFKQYRDRFTEFERYLSEELIPFAYSPRQNIINELMHDDEFYRDVEIKLKKLFNNTADVKLTGLTVKPCDDGVEANYNITINNKDIILSCTIAKPNAQF